MNFGIFRIWITEVVLNCNGGQKFQGKNFRGLTKTREISEKFLPQKFRL